MCAPSTLLSWSGQTLLRSFSPSQALAAPTGEGGWKVEDGREGNASEEGAIIPFVIFWFL